MDSPAQTLKVPPGTHQRVDTFMARTLNVSRSRIHHWIELERVAIHGTPVRKNMKLAGGEEIRFEPVDPPAPDHVAPEPMDLDNLVIQIAEGETCVDLTLNSTGSNATHADPSTFVAEVIRDMGPAFTDGNVITSGTSSN